MLKVDHFTIDALRRRFKRTAHKFGKSPALSKPVSGLTGHASQGDAPAMARRTQPTRAAVIGRTIAEAREAEAALGLIDDVIQTPPKDVRLFSLAGGEIGLPGSCSTAASFFHTRADRLFDLVYVDHRLRLFDTPFGENVIAHVNALARHDGHLILPNWRSQIGDGGVGSERLDAWFGDKGIPLACGHRLYLAQPAMRPPPSVLSWYVDHGAQLAMEELLRREGDPSVVNGDPLDRAFLLGGMVTPETVRGARSGEGGDGVKQVVEDILASHAYLIGGVSYKAALIRHILDQLMPAREGLAYVDVGGGFGALAAELLLSSDPDRFAFAITRDIAGQNIPLARSLYAGLNDHLEGRFKFSLGPAESFVFDDGYDVVSFVGSLLYVDKTELDALLDRVWASIRPGGVLIVHENIKSPAFTRDADVMFEADKLDARLGRFGALRYFHSSACKELSPEQVAKKTVFRVLAKPA